MNGQFGSYLFHNLPSSLVVMVCWTVATTVLVVSLILLNKLPAAPLNAFMLVAAVLRQTQDLEVE
jgi:hypothetical protein